MNKNDLANNIFNALFDDEDLNEMYQKGFIAQPLGYQISSVAIIGLEIDETYDRLQQENAELREFVLSISNCDTHDACDRPFIYTKLVNKAKQLLNKEGE